MLVPTASTFPSGENARAVDFEMGDSFGRGEHGVFIGRGELQRDRLFPVSASRISADGFQFPSTLLLPLPIMINVGLPFAMAISFRPPSRRA